jgi:hypothetical protein
MFPELEMYTGTVAAEIQDEHLRMLIGKAQKRHRELEDEMNRGSGDGGGNRISRRYSSDSRSGSESRSSRSSSRDSTTKKDDKTAATDKDAERSRGGDRRRRSGSRSKREGSRDRSRDRRHHDSHHRSSDHHRHQPIKKYDSSFRLDMIYEITKFVT